MTAARAVAALAEGVAISGLGAGIVALGAGALRLRPGTRSRAGLFLLAVAALGPVTALARAGLDRPEQPVEDVTTAPVALAPVAIPAQPATQAIETDPSADGSRPAISAGLRRPVVAIREGRWAEAILALLVAGAALGLLRLGLRLGRVRRLKGSAISTGDPAWPRLVARVRPGRPVSLLVSSEVTGPMVVGYRSPAVLVPPDLLEGLGPAEREQILFHELVHLARRDDWALLGQRVLEAIAWYHPAVWLLGRRLELDRELACDEAVAGRLGDARHYARTLLRLALVLRAGAPSSAPGLLSARSRLARRIEALTRGDDARLRVRIGSGAAAVALAGGLLQVPRVEVRPPVGEMIAVEDRPGPRLSDEELGRALDAELQAFADSGFSGNVVVARGGRVVLDAGYGLADRARGRPAGPETRYALAGITKAVTATAVARLAAAGRLRFDDPIGRYLPELSAGAGAVTIDQLLTHRDGLARASAPIFRADGKAFLAALDRTPRAFPAGRGFRYNDFGHSVLAIIVERITGERFEDHVRRTLFAPLGLDFRFEDEGGELAVEYQGPPARQTAIPRRPYLWGRRGALGLVGTAREAHRWLEALEDPAVIGPEIRRTLLEPRAEAPWGATIGYGWDWWGRADGSTSLRRIAGTPGFEGELVASPTGGWTAAILVNSRVGWRFRVWDAIDRLAR